MKIDNPEIVTTIELGHATDTTIARVSAGVVAVEGVTVPTISSTNTLANKRITKRTLALSANSATPAINGVGLSATNGEVLANFGASAFAYTPASG